MSGVEEILVKVVSQTDGWCIVVVFGIYLTYRAYRAYEDGRAVRVLEKAVAQLLDDLNSKMTTLVSRIDRVLTER